MAPKSRDLMKYRSNRQQTFVETVKVAGGGESRWSDLIGESSIESLVDLGFYYAPTKVNKNRVICFLCNKSESVFDEVEIDSIAVQHYRKSKACVRALIALSNQMRSQFDSKEAILSYWQNHEQKVLSSPLARPAQRFRERTYGDAFVLDSKEGYKPNSTTLAAAGFFYAPLDFQDDKVSCVYCGCSLDHWEQDDDPVEEHKQNSRGFCYFLDQLGFDQREENQQEVSGVDSPKIDKFLGLFSDTDESDKENVQNIKQGKNEPTNVVLSQGEDSIQEAKPESEKKVNLLKAPKLAKEEEKTAKKFILIDDEAVDNDNEVEEVSDFDDSDYGNNAEEQENNSDDEIAIEVEEKDVKDYTNSEADVSTTTRRSKRIRKLRAEKDPNIDYWDKVPDDDLYDEFMGAARRTTKSTQPIAKDRSEDPSDGEGSNDNVNDNESDGDSSSDNDSETEEVAEDSLKDFYDDDSTSEILDESNYIPEGSDNDNVDEVNISSNSVSEVDDSLITKKKTRKRKTPESKGESNEEYNGSGKKQKSQEPIEEVISSAMPKKLKFTKKSASATPPRFDETNEDMDIYQDANVENLEMNVKVVSTEKLSPIKDSKPESHILPPRPTIHSLEFAVDSENSREIGKSRITNTKPFKTNKKQRRNIFDMSFENEFPSLQDSLSPVRIPANFGKRSPITSLPTLTKEDLEVQKNTSIVDAKQELSPSLSEQAKIEVNDAKQEMEPEENESKHDNRIEDDELDEIDKDSISGIEDVQKEVVEVVAKERVNEGYDEIREQLPQNNNEDKDEAIYSSGESDVDYANYIEDIRGINAEISRSMEVIEQELEQGEAPGESEVDSAQKSSTENEVARTETNESETSLEIGDQIDAESTKLDIVGLEKDPTVNGEMAGTEVSKEIVDSVNESSEEVVTAIEFQEDQQEELSQDTAEEQSSAIEQDNADEIDVEVDEVTEISFRNTEVEPQKQQNEPPARYAVPESSLVEEIKDSVRSYDDSTNRLTISKIRSSLPVQESTMETASKEQNESETKQSIVEDSKTNGVDIGLSSPQVSPIAHNTSSRRASSLSNANSELFSGNTPSASISRLGRADAMIESSTPQNSNSIRSLTVKEKISQVTDLPKKWVQKPLVQFSEELANLEETAVHLRNLAASGYDLRDDPGDLTSLLADMPEEEENMTIKEWVENCATNCRNLIEDQCDQMTAFVVNEYKRAISVIEALPTID
ncbi:predicted protein [Scheffersomyces stipitis CBS 6054]|uniref:Uncharacterized protein n=1 Tax=Scheffersomyces stipitis (strain ATCC 58785 / CBS 6054 / NBRC 10063 / NRRL Y-11545) TaxID=322104 RepID=A3M035_PICST|nr:predicted protein [Scheffersomyces stipitis CBS 6054]ABN68644.2 predicted protein [Scheffersomyces stipitis CBS 6054]